MTPTPRILLLSMAAQGALSRPWDSRPTGTFTTRHQSAFVPSPLLTRTFSTSSAPTLLHATSKKKKSKSSNNSSSGGFGKSTSSPKRSKNASSGGGITYPDLEPQVRQTLIPSSMDIRNEDNGGALAEEMYDRLEDIYGLEKFNFGGEGAIFKSIGVSGVSGSGGDNGDNAGVTATDDNAGSGSLFDDILTGGATSSTNANSNNPLDDFLLSSQPDSTSSLFPNLESTPSANSMKNAAAASFDLNSIAPFDQFRVLHTDPMVLAIDDFFTSEECDRYVQISLDSEKDTQQQNNANGGEKDEITTTTTTTATKDENLQPLLLGQSQTVGKDSRSKAQRTSTTWFHYYEGVPELMAKASRLLGLEGIERWEEPQTVRYRRNEKFTWHLDALSPEEATNPSGAGQRVATLLVYLTDLPKNSGGATMFRDLGGGDGEEPLKVRPKKGSALLFFPAAGGIPNAPFDIRTLHCGEAVAEDAEHEKWIAQLWLRQRNYSPTAPVGNVHGDAAAAIGKYCDEAALV